MGFNPSELAAGEYVVFHTRAHWKVLVAPVLVLIVAVICWVVFWTVVIPEDKGWAWARWTVSALAALAV
ncbi:MAG: hypothetical protein LBG11_10040, partial [Bifidobacteriaceae bacterium]|nr:hypothetical protein [Bifidobacteriaceae bacterium]